MQKNVVHMEIESMPRVVDHGLGPARCTLVQDRNALSLCGGEVGSMVQFDTRVTGVCARHQPIGDWPELSMLWNPPTENRAKNLQTRRVE